MRIFSVLYIVACMESSWTLGDSIYLTQKLSQGGIEPHEIPRIRGNNIHVFLAHVLGSCAHRRLDRLPRDIHQQLGEPFEDFLNLLGLRLEEVFPGEGNANVADAAGDLQIRLERSSVVCHRV